MTGQRRAAYLEAMGIPVWVERTVLQQRPMPAGNAVAALNVTLCSNSGNGSSWLWLVADSGLQDNRLLADIRRAVGDTQAGNICHPVATGGEPLETMLTGHLITRMVVFGDQIVADNAIGETSCNIVQAPSLDSLSDSAEKKKQLWVSLKKLLDYQHQ